MAFPRPLYQTKLSGYDQIPRRNVSSSTGSPHKAMNDSNSSKSPRSLRASRRSRQSTGSIADTTLDGPKQQNESLGDRPVFEHLSKSYPSSPCSGNQLSPDPPGKSQSEYNAMPNSERPILSPAYRRGKKASSEEQVIPVDRSPHEQSRKTTPDTSKHLGGVGAARSPTQSPESPNHPTSLPQTHLKGQTLDQTASAPIEQHLPAGPTAGLKHTGSSGQPTDPASPASSATTAEACDIHKKLQEVFKSPLTTGEQPGYIYILFDPERPNLRKIGRSIEADKRLKTIERSCDIQVHQVYKTSTNNSARVEALIQNDLSDLCRPYDCNSCWSKKDCPVKHREWFDVDEETAIATVNKWVNFMEQEQPYYDIGTKELRPFWKHRVNTKDFVSKDHNLAIDMLRVHWARILSPPLADRLEYKVRTVMAHTIWKMIWRFWWQVNAMGAWTATFIAFQNPATFVFMILSIFGTFVSMAADSSPTETKKKGVAGGSPKK